MRPNLLLSNLGIIEVSESTTININPATNKTPIEKENKEIVPKQDLKSSTKAFPVTTEAVEIKPTTIIDGFVTQKVVEITDISEKAEAEVYKVTAGKGLDGKVVKISKLK